MKKALNLIFTCLLLATPLVISAAEYSVSSEDILNNLSFSTSNSKVDTKTISVNSNNHYSVSESSAWITINKTSGTYTVKASQNVEDKITTINNCSEGTNLALNATIIDFSSEQNTDNGVTNIVDGDDGTTNRWSAEFFPQYAVIDLGAENSINGINLVPYADRAYQFLVEGSTSSGSGYSVLVDATDNTSGGSLINKTFASTNVRYVKLTITGASGYTGDWSSIREFEVLCSGETVTNSLAVSAVSNFSANGESQSVSVTSNVNWTVSENSSWVSVNTNTGSNNGSFTITASENLSINERSANITITGADITKTLTVTQEGQDEVIFTPESCTAGINLAENGSIIGFSSEQNTDNGVANLIDGNVENRWSAEFFPQYAVIDLGAAYEVDEINLVPYQDRAYQFMVEGSSSATSGFSTLVDATNNTSGGSNINRTFTSQSVRYVKLTITGASGYTGDWSSIKDFEVLCAGEEVVINNLTVSSISGFSADGESQTVSVTSNLDWTVSENSSWISVSSTSGSDNGSFTITASKNTSTDERSTNITITGADITKTLTVTQEGQEELIFTPESCTAGINLAQNGSIIDFSSQQNTDNAAANLIDGNDGNKWSAEFFPQYAVIDLGAVYEIDEINLVPYSDRAYQFIVEGSPSSASSSFNILTDATDNTSGGSNINRTFTSQNVRYVKLTITGASGYTGDWSSIKEFEVLCAGEEVVINNLTVSSISDFAADGESQSVSITSNIDWTVSENSSWIAINTTSGSGNGSFTITASENSSTIERSTNITITGADITKTLTVTQEGQDEVIFTPEPCTAGINLAQNGSIIDFSSEQSTDNGVANLIDGDDGNRWSAEFFPQYAVIDLGAVYEVEEVQLVPFDSRAYQYTVEGSASASNYSSLVDASGNTTEASSFSETFDLQNIRYVKLTITGVTGSYTGNWASINEFKVICAGEVIIPDALSISSVNNFSADVDSQNVTVTSNVNWTVSENSSWVSITNGSGSNNGSFTINTSKNTSTSSRSATVTINGGSLSQSITVTQVGAFDPGNLNPNLPPSSNFDLSQWYLSVPIDEGDGYATTIQVEALNNGYELKDYDGKDYFYTGSDGGMVFRNYPKNAKKTSKSTSYTRTELREMLTGGSGDVSNSTKVPANNWYFSSSDEIPSGNEDSDDNAGGVDGVLTAKLKVNRVTRTSDSDSQVGRIIVGQIHASKNEPNRLYYHKQPDHDKGAIYICHEDFDGNETYYNVIGNYVYETGSKAGDYSGAGEPSDGIALNEEFSYKIEVIGNDQWVTISRPEKDDIRTYIDMNKSEYDTNNDYMYFKAGVYSQNKSCKDDNDYDQVTFYDLKQTHNAVRSSKNLTETKDLTKELIEDITVYPNPFTETINIRLGEDSFGVKSVALIDGLGRMVISEDRNGNENLIQINGNFSSGTYFIQLLDINGTVIAVRKGIHN